MIFFKSGINRDNTFFMWAAKASPVWLPAMAWHGTAHNNFNCSFLQKVLYNHDFYVIAAAAKLAAEPAA